MIFSEKSIQDILSGKKTMTRRLVKDGHEPVVLRTFDNAEIIGFRKLKPNYSGKGNPYTNIYWKNQDYAVQNGRGKGGLWYCPKCKSTYCYPSKKEIIKMDTLEALNEIVIQPIRDIEVDKDNTLHFYRKCTNCKGIMKPLRVVIKSIRKEKLLDISEEDAKKEGYENRQYFFNAFYEINRNKKRDYPPREMVWVIEFQLSDSPTKK